MAADRAEYAEAVDDVIGDEVGARVARPSVVAVVILLAFLDVRGEHRRNLAFIGPVSVDQIDDVVAHHPAKPTQLFSLVLDVVPDVRRCGHAYGHRRRVPPGGRRRLANGTRGPLQELWVGELEDEPVRLTPDQLESLGPVARHPDR